MEEGLQTLPDRILRVYISPLVEIVHIREAGQPDGHIPVTVDAEAV
jgi:hypothetical protein